MNSTAQCLCAPEEKYPLRAQERCDLKSKKGVVFSAQSARITHKKRLAKVASARRTAGGSSKANRPSG